MSVRHLSDPAQLPLRQIGRQCLASSYDRRGGNHDWSNYIRREGNAAVMMEAEGPGCIDRIWTADPQKGTVRIFIDGECRIECPFKELFSRLALTHGIGGESPENYERARREMLPMGYTTYGPIAFEKSCKVTIEPEDDYLYYQITYSLLPPDEPIPSDSNQVHAAEAAFSHWAKGQPLVNAENAQRVSGAVKPGETASLFAHEGSGTVRAVRIRLKGIDPSAEAHIKESLWLLAHFDDDEPRDPSIRAPIGPMFLDYGQHPRPRSLLLGTDEAGYYCFFPMPFRSRAKIALANRSILPVSYEAEILSDSKPPARDAFRFRATWHSVTPFGPDHRDYEGLACRLLNLDGLNNVELLSVDGGGHFVGCGFNVDLRDAPTDRAACEGDEMFFIDDDARHTHNGTGLEDYLNDAWGMRGYMGPLSGDAVIGEWGDGPQLCGYRLHVSDPIPFTRSGRFTLEHGTGNNCSGHYKSVAYWYMDPARARTRVEERQWEDIRTGKRKPNA